MKKIWDKMQPYSKRGAVIVGKMADKYKQRTTRTQAVSAVPAAPRVIEVKIGLPDLPQLPDTAKLRQRLKDIAQAAPSAQRTKKASLLGGALLIAFAAYSSYPDRNNAVTQADTSDLPQGLTRGQPTFKTVLPKGKNIAQLGGWVRISPPDSNPVFAYTDSVKGTPVSVSQQPLPADFKSAPDDKVEQLALDYYARDKVMAGSTPVYVGSSTDGPQSVIFHKNNLLVLIKSTKGVDKSEWATYVSSLR